MVKDILKFIEYFALLAFYVEILLKWVDSFRGFWRSGWNVLDLLVTILVCTGRIMGHILYSWYII